MKMGDKIKEKRKEAGLTQEELGEKLGVQKSAVAKWENGRVENIKRSVMLSMSKALGVDPAYWFDDGAEAEEDDEDDFTEEQIELLARYDSLPDDKKELVLNLIRSLTE